MISPLRKAARHAAAALMALAAFAAAVPGAGAEDLAKNLFGAKTLPAALPAKSFGFYSKGCFSGGVAIATDGPTWQSMRLSRNRRWGHPTMIKLIEKLSHDAVQDGWPGLLLGDISQPRGGPMLTGHASHQIGLDADIWLNPMPPKRLTAEQRETRPAVSMIKKGGMYVDDRLWTPAHLRLLRRAASYPEVERILVNPGIKKKLCETATGDRAWLQKVRPFWGHDYHFHIRIGCQPGSADCKPQAPVKAGDGCDSSLNWWFTKAAKLPDNNDESPKARDLMTMKSMPAACRAVLAAPSPESEAVVTLGDVGGSMSVATVAPRAVEVPFANRPVPPAEVGTDAFPPAPVGAYAPLPDSGVPIPQFRPRK